MVLVTEIRCFDFTSDQSELWYPRSEDVPGYQASTMFPSLSRDALQIREPVGYSKKEEGSQVDVNNSCGWTLVDIELVQLSLAYKGNVLDLRDWQYSLLVLSS